MRPTTYRLRSSPIAYVTWSKAASTGDASLFSRVGPKSPTRNFSRRCARSRPAAVSARSSDATRFNGHVSKRSSCSARSWTSTEAWALLADRAWLSRWRLSRRGQAGHFIDVDRFADYFDLDPPKRFELELAVDQLLGHFAHDCRAAAGLSRAGRHHLLPSGLAPHMPRGRGYARVRRSGRSRERGRSRIDDR